MSKHAKFLFEDDFEAPPPPPPPTPEEIAAKEAEKERHRVAAAKPKPVTYSARQLEEARKAGYAEGLTAGAEQTGAAIEARAILIPCSDDLYFPPEDNAIEVRHMGNAQLRPYSSPWGHCVANPGYDEGFERFLDDCIKTVL